MPTQFESSLYSIFVRAGSICDWNKILYTSFFIYTFKSTTKTSAPLYVYNMIYKYNDLKVEFKKFNPNYVLLKCMD